MNPALPKFYYVYILKNDKHNRLYIDCTSDLLKMLQEYNSGKCFSTKNYLPVNLIYFEAYLSRIDAFNIEKRLKQFESSVTKLKERIKDSLERRAG